MGNLLRSIQIPGGRGARVVEGIWTFGLLARPLLGKDNEYMMNSPINRADIRFAIQIIFCALMIGIAIAACSMPIYAVSHYFR
jgi:hypothetical protein